jgi:fucose permease
MNEDSPDAQQSARSARIAVSSYFAIMGIVCAAWVSSIPAVKELLGLDDAELGLFLFAGPVGSVISYTFISPVVSRLGSRRATELAASIYCFVVASIGACFFFRASVSAWCVSLAFFGGIGSFLNVAANTQAGLVEKLYGRTIMNSFHAMWSGCFLAGVALAYLAPDLNVSPAARFALTLGLSAVLHVLSARWLVAGDDAGTRRGRTSRPDRMLLVLGIAAIVIMGMEGAVSDWAGLFYEEDLSAEGGCIQMGLFAAMVAMTVGRTMTDRLVNRFGATAVLRTYCVLSSVGLGFAMLTPFLPLSGLPLHLTAAAGYAVSGFGISGLMPIVYSRATKATAMPPGAAVTLVGSMGFSGYLIGPPLIGAVSDATCHSLALGIFCVLVLGCLFLRVDDR